MQLQIRMGNIMSEVFFLSYLGVSPRYEDLQRR